MQCLHNLSVVGVRGFTYSEDRKVNASAEGMQNATDGQTNRLQEKSYVKRKIVFAHKITLKKSFVEKQ